MLEDEDMERPPPLNPVQQANRLMELEKSHNDLSNRFDDLLSRFNDWTDTTS